MSEEIWYFAQFALPLTLSKVLTLERKNKRIYFVLYSLIRTFALQNEIYYKICIGQRLVVS